MMVEINGKKYEIVGCSFDTSNNSNKKFFKPVYIMPDGDIVACDGTHDFDYDPNKEVQIIPKESIRFMVSRQSLLFIVMIMATVWMLTVVLSV